jgi:hypothetical protein
MAARIKRGIFIGAAIARTARIAKRRIRLAPARNPC